MGGRLGGASGVDVPGAAPIRAGEVPGAAPARAGDGPSGGRPGKNADGPGGAGKGSKLERLAGAAKGPAKVLGIAALVITGLIFLPELLMDNISDAVFPFLPDEYRELACAGCSCISCCMTCCAIVIAVVSMMGGN